MARSVIRERIEALGVSNKYIIGLIYLNMKDRIPESQFCTAINQKPELWQDRQKDIAMKAMEILDKLEAERRKD